FRTTSSTNQRTPRGLRLPMRDTRSTGAVRGLLYGSQSRFVTPLRLELLKKQHQDADEKHEADNDDVLQGFRLVTNCRWASFASALSALSASRCSGRRTPDLGRQYGVIVGRTSKCVFR